MDLVDTTNGVTVYKGYRIRFYESCPPGMTYIDNVYMDCHPSDWEKVKQMIDRWEFPKEFANKLENLIDD